MERAELDGFEDLAPLWLTKASCFEGFSAWDVCFLYELLVFFERSWPCCSKDVLWFWSTWRGFQLESQLPVTPETVAWSWVVGEKNLEDPARGGLMANVSFLSGWFFGWRYIGFPQTFSLPPLLGSCGFLKRDECLWLCMVLPDHPRAPGLPTRIWKSTGRRHCWLSHATETGVEEVPFTVGVLLLLCNDQKVRKCRIFGRLNADMFVFEDKRRRHVSHKKNSMFPGRKRWRRLRMLVTRSWRALSLNREPTGSP